MSNHLDIARINKEELEQGFGDYSYPSKKKPTKRRPRKKKPTKRRPTKAKPTKRKPTKRKPTKKKPTKRRQTKVDSGMRFGHLRETLPKPAKKSLRERQYEKYVRDCQKLIKKYTDKKDLGLLKSLLEDMMGSPRYHVKELRGKRKVELRKMCEGLDDITEQDLDNAEDAKDAKEAYVQLLMRSGFEEGWSDKCQNKGDIESCNGCQRILNNEELTEMSRQLALKQHKKNKEKQIAVRTALSKEQRTDPRTKKPKKKNPKPPSDLRIHVALRDKGK